MSTYGQLTTSFIPTAAIQPSYRYYRIYIHSNALSTLSSIQEIELATSPGGLDITTPGMPTSESDFVNTDRKADKAIDNTFTGSLNSWLSDVQPPNWITVDVGSAVSIAELRMWCGDEASSPNRAPEDFDLEGSHDDSIWTILKSFTGITGWVQAGGKTFLTPGPSTATLSCDFLYTPNGAIQTVLDGDQSAFSVTISGADVLSFNLLASVTIDGVAATSGVTVIPDGWHSMTGILDATADVDLLASAVVAPSDNFHTQLHNLILTDPLNGANSISIDASVQAETMPTDTDMTDPTGLISYGTWLDLHPTQQYVPLLKGGADADRAFVAFKHEAYNGDFSA